MEIDWDDIADVVVVGSGIAAHAAAVVATADGASVIVLEKEPEIGGTTVRSSATMWIPDNPVMRRKGIADPRLPALRYMARVGFPALYDRESPTLGLPPGAFRLLETFYDRGAEAYDFLDALDVVGVDEDATAFPDYHADLPENEAPVGRSLRIGVPDGFRFGVDPPAGNRIVGRMAAFVAGRGGRTRLGCRVVDLVRRDDGAVVGVVAHEGGTTRLIGARRAVVFGTGGFLHDDELRRAFLRGPVFGGAAAPGSTGDFIAIASRAGARLGAMGHAWWDQVPIEIALAGPTVRDLVWPFGDSMLMVNRHGDRVMNEKMPYSERGPVHFNWDASRREYPNHLLFMVYDEQVAQDPADPRFRWPIPLPGQHASHVVSGATLEDLAGAIATRLHDLRAHTGGVALGPGFVDGLRAAIARFDRFARAGRDTDFRRGESLIEQAWNRQGQSDPSPTTMRPFAPVGPYHCIVLGAGALDTKGGPVTDERARVLDSAGLPIPRLYGAGNCVASPTGQGYYGPGGTVGPALVFGTIAGREAARQPGQPSGLPPA